MGRTSKKNEVAKATEADMVEDGAKTVETEVKVEESAPSSFETELMRMYPQYERLWITSKGFVHPEGVPSSLVKDAKLYTNIFFNK